MKKITSILFLLLFTSSVFAAKLYTGGEKYEKVGQFVVVRLRGLAPESDPQSSEKYEKSRPVRSGEASRISFTGCDTFAEDL